MDDGDGEMMVMLMTSMMVIVMTVIKPETANDNQGDTKACPPRA